MSKTVVILPVSLLETVVRRSRRHYPNEYGGFLLANYNSLPETRRKESIYRIDQFAIGTAPVGDTWSWSFTDECIQKVYRRAANRKLVIGGMFHSHPWKKLPPAFTMHSQADSNLQNYARLPVSLVVGVTPEGWRAHAWTLGSSAPAEIRLKDRNGRIRFIGELARRYKDHPVWGAHLDLDYFKTVHYPGKRLPR